MAPDFAAHLHAHTWGNPLFLADALADFERRGWLCPEESVWKCGVDLEVLGAAVPDGTRELIAYRIDQKPLAMQRVLEAASVAGMELDTQAVSAALEIDSEAVEVECERLARASSFLEDGAEIRWPDGSRGRRHRFRHELYRRVLYDRVPPTRRQTLHRRIAERLERGYGGQVHTVAAQISFHYEQAGDLERAIDRIEAMVREARARRATPEVESLDGSDSSSRGTGSSDRHPCRHSDCDGRRHRDSDARAHPHADRGANGLSHRDHEAHEEEPGVTPG